MIGMKIISEGGMIHQVDTFCPKCSKPAGPPFCTHCGYKSDGVQIPQQESANYKIELEFPKTKRKRNDDGR